jgi:recombination DNA repair RAD52 pathway protein
MTDIKIYTAQELQRSQNPILSAEQMNFLLKPTPKAFRKMRPGKGGGQWEYVSGTYVKKVLNLMFGFDWSFEVKQFQINDTAKQCHVLGRLTCRGTNGREIVKEQFGRVDIKYRQGGTQPLDLGNDLKAATTDALKKCAAELGIAMDVYSGEEMRHIEVVETMEEKVSLEAERAAKWIAEAASVEALQQVPEKYRNEDYETKLKSLTNV